MQSSDPQLPGTSAPDASSMPEWASSSPLMRTYFTDEWGLPVRGDNQVFERLSLEAFQVGLSWSLVLKRRDNLREAFHHFDLERCAALTDDDLAQAHTAEGMIRNDRKIRAVRTNAQAALQLDEGLSDFIWSYQPENTPMPRRAEDIPSSMPYSVQLAKDLKKRGFTMVGPVNMFALMEAIGIVDTHLVDSPRRGSSGLWHADGTRQSTTSSHSVTGDETKHLPALH